VCLIVCWGVRISGEWQRPEKMMVKDFEGAVDSGYARVKG
jgi:hypothetical protein